VADLQKHKIDQAKAQADVENHPGKKSAQDSLKYLTELTKTDQKIVDAVDKSLAKVKSEEAEVEGKIDELKKSTKKL